jgi:hypothetical protein
MRVFVPIELIAWSMFLIWLAFSAYEKNAFTCMLAIGGLLSVLFVMAHRLVAYIILIDGKATAMENVNALLRTLFISPASREAKKAAGNAPK